MYKNATGVTVFNPYVLASREFFVKRTIVELARLLQRKRNLIYLIFATNQEQLNGYVDFCDQFLKWFDKMYCLAVNTVPCIGTNVGVLRILKGYICKLDCARRKLVRVRLQIANVSNDQFVRFNAWSQSAQDMQTLINADKIVVVGSSNQPPECEINVDNCETKFTNFNIIGGSGAVTNPQRLQDDFAKWENIVLKVVNRTGRVILRVKLGANKYSEQDINRMVGNISKKVATLLAHVKNDNCENILFFVCESRTNNFMAWSAQQTVVNIDNVVRDISNAAVIYYIAMVSKSKFLLFQHQAKLLLDVLATDNDPDLGILDNLLSTVPCDGNNICNDFPFPRNALTVNECMYIGQQTARFVSQKQASIRVLQQPS